MAQYNFDNIPQELRDCPQWVVWRKVKKKDGNLAKMPYQVSGREAKTNDRQSWSTFVDVTRAYEQGGFDGIGFVFTENDPFVGIDIDHCILENSAFSDMAQDIVYQLDSYTERSPSGDGLHVIIKGELPDRVKNTGGKNPSVGLEIYRYGRYFTFTGDILHNKSVEKRTKEIKVIFDTYIPDKQVKYKHSRTSSPQSDESYSSLSDRELLDKMFNSKRGEAIKQLFDGFLINDDHSASDMAFCNHLAFWANRDAERMDAIFRSSGLMRDKWESVRGDATYGQMTIDNAIQNCPITISEFIDQSKPYNSYESEKLPEPKKGKAPNFRHTELGNAERIVYYHGNNIRYCPERDWLIWDKTRWKEDSKKMIETITAKTLRKIHDEADAEKDEERAKVLQTWANKCERRAVRMASISDMKPMVSVTNEELDQHPYLFNVKNGVIDLKAGALKPHTREYLLTKKADVEYQKDAKCPSWLKFLDSVFQDENGNVDHELIRFMQKAIGYSLTGDISEQVMFFLFGTGRNGKSTFINTVQKLFGSYGKQTNSDTFIRKKNDNGINNDIARLDKARFVSAVESEDGQQLSESLVKQITGGEKMTARFMRQEFFEFVPEFKIFFTTNHPPVIRGSDEGIWRRICQIPFKVTIPKNAVDKKLPEKLQAEMSGILRWAVEGCLLWQKEGLEQPESIQRATQEYREDMDIIGPFIEECCVISQNAQIETKDLYRAYKDYCWKSGEIELKNRAFYRNLESRGFVKKRGAKNKVFFHGIALSRNKMPLRVVEGVTKRVTKQVTEIDTEKL